MGTKAPQLARSRMQDIYRYKCKNPKMPYTEIARTFNVTYNQAREACLKGERGELRKTRPRTKTKAVAEIIEAGTADELLERQYHYAIAQLHSETKIAADDRIAMLDKLFSSRKILQQVKLENHIKRADAEIIARIIRRFEPEASDERVIAIYREELEKSKMKD